MRSAHVADSRRQRGLCCTRVVKCRCPLAHVMPPAPQADGPAGGQRLCRTDLCDREERAELHLQCLRGHASAGGAEPKRDPGRHVLVRRTAQLSCKCVHCPAAGMAPVSARGMLPQILPPFGRQSAAAAAVPPLHEYRHVPRVQAFSPSQQVACCCCPSPLLARAQAGGPGARLLSRAHPRPPHAARMGHHRRLCLRRLVCPRVSACLVLLADDRFQLPASSQRFCLRRCLRSRE